MGIEIKTLLICDICNNLLKNKAGEALHVSFYSDPPAISEKLFEYAEKDGWKRKEFENLQWMWLCPKCIKKIGGNNE